MLMYFSSLDLGLDFYLSHECFSGLLEQPDIASAPDTFLDMACILANFFPYFVT